MDLSQDELLSRLRDIDEYEFEELVADVWEQNGWETTVTTGSNDGGIDVIAEKSSPYPQKHLLQAKRYAAGNKIGSPDIQQYYSLKNKPDVDAVAVVTTSSFSSQAEQRAKELNLKLVNSEELYQIISELDNPQDLLSKHIRMDSKSIESESSTESAPHSSRGIKTTTASVSRTPTSSEPSTESTSNISTSLGPSTDTETKYSIPSDKGSKKLDDKTPGDVSIEDFYSDLTEDVRYSFRQTNSIVCVLITDRSIHYIEGQVNGIYFRRINYSEISDTKITSIGQGKNKLTLKFGSEYLTAQTTKDANKIVDYIEEMS